MSLTGSGCEGRTAPPHPKIYRVHPRRGLETTIRVINFCRRETRDCNFSHKICYLANQAYGSRLEVEIVILTLWPRYFVEIIPLCRNSVVLESIRSFRWIGKQSRRFFCIVAKNLRRWRWQKLQKVQAIFEFHLNESNAIVVEFGLITLDSLLPVRKRFKNVFEDILENCLHLCLRTRFSSQSHHFQVHMYQEPRRYVYFSPSCCFHAVTEKVGTKFASYCPLLMFYLTSRLNLTPRSNYFALQVFVSFFFKFREMILDTFFNTSVTSTDSDLNFAIALRNSAI